MEFGKKFDFVHEDVKPEKLYNILIKIVDYYNKNKEYISITEKDDTYSINFGFDSSSLTIVMHLYSHAEIFLSNKYYKMFLIAKLNFKTSEICQKINSLALLKKKQIAHQINDIILSLDKIISLENDNNKIGITEHIVKREKTTWQKILDYIKK